MASTTGRATPLAVDERRAAIVEAVIPLVLEHGAAITTRQIAESACVAEGTLFRAFGDKESIIRAAVETYLDPEPMRRSLAEIRHDLPLADKVREIIGILQRRFVGVFQMMNAAGLKGPPPGATNRHVYAEIVADVLRDDLDRLAWAPERVGSLLRLIAFASSIPQFNESVGFTLDELTQFALHGVVGPADPVSLP